jgi:hypothetical protein
MKPSSSLKLTPLPIPAALALCTLVFITSCRNENGEGLRPLARQSAAFPPICQSANLPKSICQSADFGVFNVFNGLAQMTLTEMAKAVLDELGVVAANETPSAADADYVKTRYERWRKLAAQRFIVDWDAATDIPDGAEDAVTLIIAYMCAPAFGVPKDREAYEMGRTLLFEYRDGWKPNPPMTIQAF